MVQLTQTPCNFILRIAQTIMVKLRTYIIPKYINIFKILQKRMVHMEKSLSQSVNLSAKLELFQTVREPIILNESRYVQFCVFKKNM